MEKAKYFDIEELIEQLKSNKKLSDLLQQLEKEGLKKEDGNEEASDSNPETQKKQTYENKEEKASPWKDFDLKKLLKKKNRARGQIKNVFQVYQRQGQLN